MKGNFLKKNNFLYYILSSVFVYAIIASSVNKVINEDDLNAIKNLKVDKHCNDLFNYEKEIKCIKAIQLAVIDSVEFKNCRLGFIVSEPKGMLEANRGCCFDKARYIEKSLMFYGMKTRRVFLIDISKYGYLSLLIPGKQFVPSSHAASEVKTSKGWLGIDSDKNHILINDKLDPFPFNEANKNNIDLPDAPIFKKEFFVVKGLYSRRGNLYRPYFPLLPEINYGEFKQNFF